MISSHLLSGKPVLVTGGAGFIGSQLVADLLSVGADVRVVENGECRDSRVAIDRALVMGYLNLCL